MFLQDHAGTGVAAPINAREQRDARFYRTIDVPREHRAAFVIDSLEVAEQATLRTMQAARLTD